MKKHYGTILISIVFVVVCFIYWDNYNAVASIDGIKTEVSKAISRSTKKNYYKDNIETIAQMNYEINNNKYIGEDIKKYWNDFRLAIQKTGNNSPSDSLTLSQSLTLEFYKVSFKHNNLRVNQGLTLVFIAGVFILFLYLAQYQDLLRDIVGNWKTINQVNVELLSLNGTTPIVKQPYSLARTQLAVWTFIVSSVYLYAILWDKRDISGINQTALILMGISAGTFTVGAIMDVTEIENNVQRGQNQPSQGFFRDILSDKSGAISIHRYQNVIWTLVAIIIYIYRYNNPKNLNELPELDGTILALSGISSATYLLFKSRENVIPAKVARIKLAAGNTLNEDEKKFISGSGEGFRTSVVKLMSLDNKKEIPATPEDGSNFDFVAKEYDREIYKKITATWKGKLKKDDNTEIILSGNVNEIPNLDGEVILVNLDKQT
ncbi:hypothetical protein A4H97_18000 [Niastella yeongjuensis]|uniref:Uncharacterized protein n=1 Tax=Niastella yeongjuensis TaxID=354355 RepID=A0A1V9DXM1_9BACT|nr:hypothetical protein [Niastella yeongjuensis]OQP38618.1 hypothetical protein A4H97_18000 [Niastella yeongjuensis]SEO39339.1 hypothetical protein SAMN05660816_02803 [Niastella yeongjuensis]